MELLFLTQILLYFLGGASAFLFNRREEAANRLTHLSAALAGLVGTFYSLAILSGQKGFSLECGGFPETGPLSFTVDPLSAFFIFVISFLSIATSIFAIGYTREYQGKKRIPLLGFFYNLFLLAMILVVCVQNAFYFLMFWELMSLASYFLVVFEHEKREARRAGMLYLVMTHIGTSFIAAAFWLLFLHSGTFSFDAFHANAATLPPVLKNAIFVCALIGFGTKAGVIPLHIWLPEAHPQAPSHVSALMSGVMIKTAIYGILRFLFGFLGAIPPWWGTTILTVAIVSTLLGILYALMENDLKRLLAFSSIENIGIILLGLGMGMVFKSMGNSLYASFAIAAALFHTLNHAIFKGLLFLASGAILSKTHTRNIEHLGGLIRRMPWTAALFLVGALSISALPPLNGFISEWMTFIALLLGFEGEGVGVRFFSPLLASLLGLAGALAMTCFVKAFGICFLGEPRSPHTAEASEVSGSMKWGMGILAGSCFLFAFAAPWIVGMLGKIPESFMGSVPTGGFVRNASLLSPSGVSQISPLTVGLTLLLVIPFLIVTIRLILGKQSLRVGPSWDCGLPGLTPRMQYTATGYSKPLRRIFSFLYQPTRRVELEDEGHEILRTAERFESKISHVFDDMFYKLAESLISSISQKAQQIQTGHIQLYLAYIFITLILLLLFGSRL